MSRLVRVLACFLTVLSVPCAGAPESVSADAARQWVRFTVPLPKEIAISRAVTVPRAAVSVEFEGAPPAGDLVVAEALSGLHSLLGREAGAPAAAGASFRIVLALGRQASDSLKSLPNADQAYSITPSDNGDALRLDALSPAGLLYAARTLEQLIRPKMSAGTARIPLVTVRDWPDMDARGLWGADCFAHLRWMGDRKLNIAEQISDVGVDDQGKPYARIKSGREPMITEGPRYAIEPVPVVLHLEQVGGKGVLKAHPELRAQGGQENNFCYSKPAIVDVLAEWIGELASLPHVNGVDVWMTENLHGQGGCRCADCAKTDRGVLEARAIIAGWRKAEEKHGPITLWVLTSEETESSNQLIFKEIPPEVRVWYYHSLLTYTSGQSPMLRPYLGESAKAGRWIGVVPNLVPIHFAAPFTSPQFIHYRMNEFVDKSMSGLLGYITPRLPYGFFNLEAAAEYSWNAKGRTPREFAVSYAVRQGFRDPEKYADWVEAIGTVAWHVYGSDWPFGEQRNVPGKVAGRLKKGALPELGYVLWDAYRSPFGDIKSEDQLERDVEMAARAVRLAREMGLREQWLESLIVQGYIDSLKALWELKGLVRDGRVAERDREQAERYFRMYVRGLSTTVDVLPLWEALVPKPDGIGGFTDRPVEIARGAIAEMIAVADSAGIRISPPAAKTAR